MRKYKKCLQGPRRIKNKQMVMKTLTKMKNTLEGIKSRIIEAEERISELEDRMVEITAKEQRKNNEKK